MKCCTDDDLIAELLRLVADVRRETREATIRECTEACTPRQSGARELRPGLIIAQKRLVSLLTPPSAPAEPKCAICDAKGLPQISADAHATQRHHSFDVNAPAEPKCKWCSRLEDADQHRFDQDGNDLTPDGHSFEPEEPGHG